MTTASPWPALMSELDLQAEQGRRIRLWLRDDDAIAPSPELDRLIALSERHGVPVLLATIPLLAQDALARRLEQVPLLAPCQHGCRHLNHAPAGEKKVEIGRHRAADAVLAEIETGRRRLADLFGARALPVFVPPWNRMDPALAARLPAIGFTGLSLFRGFRLGPEGGPRLVNSDLDIMDWHGGRIGRQACDLIAEMTAALALRRRSCDEKLAYGLLLHHRDHDAAAWGFIDDLLSRIAAHPAIEITSLRPLFGAPAGLD